MTKQLKEIYKKFPNRKECISFLELRLWGNQPFCPYCKKKNYSILPNEDRFHCKTCNSSFSVTVGTVFHRTKCDLQKWLLAISILFEKNFDISSRDLADIIEVTKDTAWLMIKKIKKDKINLRNLSYE